MRSTEAEGSTIDEAIARALTRLGAPRERVDIEILANATRGLFGFGGKRARVRAALRRPVSAESESSAATAESATSAPTAAHPASPAPHRPMPPQRCDGGRGSARRAVDEAPPSPAVLERARALLADVVRLCGSEATVQIAGTRLVIEGDTGGVLIGRRGTTLDALEYVVNRAVGHDEERAVHVEVDANDYRARRRAALAALAQRMAERARRKGRPVALSPLSPRERRVVHLALQDGPDADHAQRRRWLLPPAGHRAHRAARRSVKPRSGGHQPATQPPIAPGVAG